MPFLIFQVINSQYQFDDNYMMCVAQHMDEVMPFGEDPRKLASTVKRSMVAVRALEKALRSGFTIAEEMKKVNILCTNSLNFAFVVAKIYLAR